jgi:hypothetical protein
MCGRCRASMAGDDLWLVGVGACGMGAKDGEYGGGLGNGVGFVLSRQKEARTKRMSEQGREAGGRSKAKAKAHFCQVTESQSHKQTDFPSSIRFRSQADAGTNNSIQLERKGSSQPGEPGLASHARVVVGGGGGTRSGVSGAAAGLSGPGWMLRCCVAASGLAIRSFRPLHSPTA